MNSMACALSGVKNERVALVDVSVSAVLRDQLSEVTLSQTYRNDEAVNIEAVYTFAIPLDAVLLELQVEIGERVLKGVVVEKQSAEEQYEDAIASGDAAVMLEMLEPGLYTMNVGNLLPEEQATVTFSYANIYRWKGDQLRIFLPTTVAPRYGHSRHLPHQVPESSMTVENQFSLEIEATGNLQNAQFVCPSHTVTLRKTADKVVITLQEAKAVMDRDFILNIKTTNKERKFAICDADGDGLAAVASFQPFFPGLQQPRALNLAIVIDCSGSMRGDSMHQAKQALDGMLDALQVDDKVTLIAFGSSTKMLSKKLLTCKRRNLAKARRFAQNLDADMGGTAIGEALARANDVLTRYESTDIFLVTDGEVGSWELIVEKARHAGHRIFTVGVGSAVSEAFVRKLANVTGGESELVSPREGMADKVIRHFERMRAARAKRVTIQWPESAIETTPSKLGSVFEGDTIIASARFEDPAASGKVVLEVETDSGETFLQDLPIEMGHQAEPEDRISTIARLAASERLKQVKDGKGQETALHYRLVSPWTNWLVVVPRSESDQAQDMPVLRKVPQTLQAGWGGTGSVFLSAKISQIAPKALVSERVESCERSNDLEPSFMRAERRRPLHLETLIELINDDPGRMELDRVLDLLYESGLDGELADLFQRAESLGICVHVIAAIALMEILKGTLRQQLSSEAKLSNKQLQNYTDEVSMLLYDMCDPANHLAAITQHAVEKDILDQRHLEFAKGIKKRFDELRSILADVQQSAKKLIEDNTKKSTRLHPTRSEQLRSFLDLE